MTRTPNLILTGFMGTGKSSTGRKVAALLGFPFHDTDSWVVRHTRRSIPQIFEEEGEAAFRALEQEAVRALSTRSAIVISTGGGVVLDPENVRLLHECGVIVLLTASPDALMTRVGGRGDRPLLQCENPSARVRELLAAREPVYRAAAHAVVDTTDLEREAVAQEVVAIYRSLAV